MRNPFEVFGPFELEKERVVDQEYQKTFWGECDAEYPGLSEANGLYVLSLRVAANYKPNYVGITKHEFKKEIFSSHILVKILNDFVHQRGRLCLHLLAKPKSNKTGFYCVSKKSLLWTEMFLLMLCRKKNPNILNIAGHAFLEDCGIEGVTIPARGRSTSIRTFRDALGFDSFRIAGWNANGRNKSSDDSTDQAGRVIDHPTTPSQSSTPTQPTSASVDH